MREMWSCRRRLQLCLVDLMNKWTERRNVVLRLSLLVIERDRNARIVLGARLRMALLVVLAFQFEKVFDLQMKAL